MSTLTSQENMTRDSFEETIKLTLKYLFINHKKYISLDNFVRRLGNCVNVNIMSIFDCCRETKYKGMSERELMKKGIVDQKKVSKKGMIMTFYAKPDGQGAPAGLSSDMISPTIRAWLGYLYANPGACYPDVLKEF